MKKFRPWYIKFMYSGWASCYDEEFSGNGWCGHEFLYDNLSSHFNTKAKGIKVLDVGIGTGMLSAEFREQNPDCHITGIDISAAMLKKCEDKYIADTLIQNDFQREGFPFHDGSFDTVVSSGVFELLDKPETVIQEMGRVLRPGGAFAFTVYADSSYRYKCNRHPDTLIENALQDARLETAERTRFWAFEHHYNNIYYHLYTGAKHALS